MIKKTIIFSNGETYEVEIEQEPDDPVRPTRYEVRVEDGISTGEFDAYGDNQTHAWGFPCNSADEAETEFVRRIEKLRVENGYYEGI